MITQTSLVSRLPRFERVPEAVGFMRLTSRDLEIIRSVAVHRFLRSDQIISLLGGSPKQLARRLQLLFHHGYLTRPRAQIAYYQAGSLPMVYGLGKAGAEVLAQAEPIASARWSVSSPDAKHLHLAHTLMIADLTISFEIACRANPWTNWMPSELCLTSRGQELAEPFKWDVTVPRVGRLGVIPDAVFGFTVEGSVSRLCVLEADTGSMPVKRENLQQTSLWRKLVTYSESWKQGTIRERFGTGRLHVLIVTHGKDRVQHLMELIQSDLGDSKELFFVTDFSEIKNASHALAAKWYHASQGFHTLI